MVPISFAGETFQATPDGALFWPAQNALLVADLHLEKASWFARLGQFLPPYDSHATLTALARSVGQTGAARLYCLGDSFHDADGSTRLPSGELSRLRAMTAAHRFIWVQGNHDPVPPSGVGGEWVETYVTASLVFRHQATAGAQGEISGHHHPKAAVPARGGSVSRPCFVSDSRRLMMPAFGAYTGGLDVRDPAIARLFPRGGRVFLLGRERLFSFALGTLRSG